MPQLDIYTFPTQIYFVAVVSFSFLVIFAYLLIYVLFFESEVYERDENFMLSVKIATKAEIILLKTRYEFLATRLADIYTLVLKYNK